MVSNNGVFLFLIALAAFLASCGTFPPPPPPTPEKGDVQLLTEKFRERALILESQEEWYEARRLFQAVRKLDAREQTPEYDLKIARLTEKIQAQSERFFEAGVGFFEQGEKKKALGAFLEALKVNPAHAGAISYVVHRLQAPDYKIFEAPKKTDLHTIAQQVYEDPEKKVLISYFNDLQNSTVIEAGTKLKIPPSPERKKRKEEPPPFDVEKNLDTAKNYLESNRYENAINVAALIQEHDPDNVLAVNIKNEAYLQIAKHHEKFKKYIEAIEAMGKVGPDYAPAKDYMAHLQKVTKELSEHHYRQGLQHFVDEDLEKAIAEWEQALALDPNNKQAREDIEEAKNLLEKLGKVK